MRRVLVFLIIVAMAAGVGWGGNRIAQEYWARRHYQAAETALVEQNYELALAELELCLKVWPRRLEVQFRAARAARRDGQFEKAEKYLAECESAPPARLPPGVDLEFERACLRAHQGDTEGVKIYLTLLMDEKGPRGPMAQEALGLGYFQLRQLEPASKYLEPLLRANPNHLAVRLARAQMALGGDDFEGAIRDCRQAIDLSPNAFQPRYILADALHHEGRILEAIKELEPLVQAYPKRTEGLLALALFRADLHQFAKAQKLYDDALALEPNSVPALIERGRVALHQGKPGEGEPFVRRALALQPKDGEALDTMIKILEKQDKTEEAAALKKQLDDIESAVGQAFRASMAMKDNTATTKASDLVAMGDRYRQTGKDDEANRWYWNALQLDPANQEARLALADFFERTGEPYRAAYQRKLAARTK